MDVHVHHREVEMVEGEDRGKFTTVLGIGLFVALALFTSILVWVFQFGPGASFSTAAGLVGIHAISMVLFIFILHGISSLIYRILYTTPKGTAKLVHGTLHFVVCLGTTLGFGVIIVMHNLSNMAHFSGLHAWFGLVTIVLYYLQFLGGFIFFFLKVPSLSFRAWVLPIHKRFDQIIFLFAAAAVLTALMMKSMSAATAGALSSGIPAAEAVLNVAAFLTILYVFIIFYLLNEKRFSRNASPESQRLLIEAPTSTIRREIRIEKPYYPTKA